MYYDTPKQKSDNAYEQARHNANFTSIRSVAKNLINSIIGSLFARPFKRVDLESQNPPVSSAQSGPPSRDDHNGDSGDRYLLFCIDKGTPLHTWHQERMPEDSSHTNVFKFLRKRYRKHRGYYSWFTLKWIRRLFVAEVCLECISKILIQATNYYRSSRHVPTALLSYLSKMGNAPQQARFVYASPSLPKLDLAIRSMCVRQHQKKTRCTQSYLLKTLRISSRYHMN